MDRLGLVLVFLTASTGPATAASPDPKDLVVPPAELTKAHALVGKLGNKDFDEREDAQDDLARMGRRALPALIEGLNSHPSPEVRFRCQALLPKAAAEDLQARVATFLADTGGKFDHDLAGWNEFRKTTGGTPADRAVFADLLADPTNRALLVAVSGPHEELADLVAARKQELYVKRFPRGGVVTHSVLPSTTDLIALLFAESFATAPDSLPRGGAMTTLSFASADFIAEITNPGPKRVAYRAVVAHWIDTRDDAVSMYQAMTQSSNLGLTKEAGGVAGRLVRLKGGVVTYRAQAAATIARLGDKTQLPALEATLTDETLLRPARVIGRVNNEAIELQLRDVALAAALVLTDQDPAGYGFVTGAGAGGGGGRYTYSHWQIPADKRAAALGKWKAWREEHPDAGKDDGKK